MMTKQRISGVLHFQTNHDKSIWSILGCPASPIFVELGPSWLALAWAMHSILDSNIQQGGSSFLIISHHFPIFQYLPISSISFNKHKIGGIHHAPMAWWGQVASEQAWLAPANHTSQRHLSRQCAQGRWQPDADGLELWIRAITDIVVSPIRIGVDCEGFTPNLHWFVAACGREIGWWISVNSGEFSNYDWDAHPEDCGEKWGSTTGNPLGSPCLKSHHPQPPARCQRGSRSSCII